MRKKRIFIAIPIQKDLKKKIVEWGRRHKNLGVEWVASKNLHLTLIPPWYVENIDEICDLLTQIGGNFSEFKINISRIESSPKVIWTPVENSIELLKLKEALERILTKKPEKRPFKPHITIAKLRQKRIFVNEKIRWKQKVDSIVLMQSHISRKGSDYEIIHQQFLEHIPRPGAQKHGHISHQAP